MSAMNTKYVLISGGVISGIGKGVIASSVGVLLKSFGLKVTAIKIDPYINIDAGLMNPLEHGECFVLDDGGEVDLDLGNYERYLSVKLTRENSLTTGKIFQHVIERERKGAYLGKTVQTVPHITDAIQDWIQRVAQIPVDSTGEKPDVCIIELGGTVGDIESPQWVEAMRCLRRRVPNDFLHCHVSLVPIIQGEQKTKITQQAIREARSAGLSPDIIACRCEFPLEISAKEKIAMYCQVEPEQVIGVHDVLSTYHVPLLLESYGLIPILRKVLSLEMSKIPPESVTSGAQTWKTWKDLTRSNERAFEEVKICLVGKYTKVADSYLSVRKSLEHASMRCRRKLKFIMINSSHLEKETLNTSPTDFHKAWHELHEANGILIPGGFGGRGIEGMIAAAECARKKKTPFLGICLGMQVAVIEFCRNECGIPNAHSEEFEERTSDPVIIHMPEVSKETMGAVMRLGLRDTHFQENSDFSKLRALYEASGPQTDGSAGVVNGNVAVTADGSSPSRPTKAEPPIIAERHRHKYEVNPDYVERISRHGLDFIGKDDSGKRMEILELRDHPWFVGVQYHPEYLSRVLRPSMPFLGFFAAAAGCLDEVMEKKDLLNGYTVGMPTI